MTDEEWHTIVDNSKNLTPEQLDSCASIKPWMALEYRSDKVTEEQIDIVRRKQNDR